MDAIPFSPVLVVAGLTWAINELTKQLVGRSRGRRWFDPGGMPSGHAATMAALATAIGLSEGVGSPLFALAIILCGIIFSDAHRVRWSVGEQAARLNELGKRAKLKPLPIVRGHTKAEVIIGAIYGAVLAWGLWQLLQ